MQITCKVLNRTPAFTQAYAAGDFATLSNALMSAGIAQEAQNTLAKNNGGVTQPLARCFTPGQEYIDPILASVTFPFQLVNGKPLALAPVR